MIIVETTGCAPTNALVVEDESHLGVFYAEIPTPALRRRGSRDMPGPAAPSPTPRGVQ
ncbi:hypothetical protein IQ782_25125 [Salipiger pacificus]|uniref:Uncharacterized protein n=1 Tax=Salipiger mangrovisoli TaxID=2865933 RepID=A0ABR9X9G7_9RHOB|nr:hypothetical protein [Salipiger mangrovisoli]